MKFFLFVAVAFLSVIAIPQVSLAQTSLQDSIQQQNQAFSGAVDLGEAQEPGAIAARLINISLSILGILLTAYIMYGGYLIMFSQTTFVGEGHDQDEVNKGKRVIQHAIMGLFIILVAWAITRFVFSGIGGATAGGICINDRRCASQGIECPVGSSCDASLDACVAGAGCEADNECPSSFTCRQFTPQDRPADRDIIDISI